MQKVEPAVETDAWRDRALLAERRVELLREVLLDVDAILNLSSREAPTIFSRLKREARPVSLRVQEALLETAQTHCLNWGWSCEGSQGCSCRCERCPGALSVDKAARPA